MHTVRELSYLSELTAVRLRAVRKYARDSQQLLAALIEVHRPAVTLIEQDRQHLTVAQLVRIVDHYQIDARWLLGMDLWYEPNTIPAPRCWDQYAYLCADEYQRGIALEQQYRNLGRHKKKKEVKK